MQLDEFNELMIQAITLATCQLRLCAYKNYGAPIASIEFLPIQYEMMLENNIKIATKLYNRTFIKICKNFGMDDLMHPEKTNKTLENIGESMYHPVFNNAKKALTKAYEKTNNLNLAMDQADSVFISNMVSRINEWFGVDFNQVESKLLIPMVLIEDHHVSEPDWEVSSWIADVGAAFVSVSDSIGAMLTATPGSISNESPVNFLSFFPPLMMRKNQSPVSVTEMSNEYVLGNHPAS